jgi:hypothetical protein
MTLAFVSAYYCVPSVTYRSPDKYFDYFEKILISGIPVFLYMDEKYKARTEELVKYYPHFTVLEYIKLDMSWLPKNVSLPKVCTPNKDTKEYFCIQLSKLKHMADANTKIPSTFTHLAWIDFGIFHMFKDRPRMVRALQTLSIHQYEKGKVWSPGCWANDGKYELWDRPSWCHCGSILIGDRNLYKGLYEKQQELLKKYLPKLTWEVNYWTMMGNVFTMYTGEHNDSILLGFPIQWPSNV